MARGSLLLGFFQLLRDGVNLKVHQTGGVDLRKVVDGDAVAKDNGSHEEKQEDVIAKRGIERDGLLAGLLEDYLYYQVEKEAADGE